MGNLPQCSSTAPMRNKGLQEPYCTGTEAAPLKMASNDISTKVQVPMYTGISPPNTIPAMAFGTLCHHMRVSKNQWHNMDPKSSDTSHEDPKIGPLQFTAIPIFEYSDLLRCSDPKDHINNRILQNIISGIPPVLCRILVFMWSCRLSEIGGSHQKGP